MNRLLSSIAALALLFSVAQFLTGCANQPKDPQAITFITLSDTWTVVRSAMVVYTDAYAQGKVSEEDREKIDKAYVKFRVSMLAAIDLAGTDWENAATPDGLASLSATILNLIDQLDL